MKYIHFTKSQEYKIIFTCTIEVVIILKKCVLFLSDLTDFAFDEKPECFTVFHAANVLTYIVACPDGQGRKPDENGVWACYTCPAGSYGDGWYDSCYPCPAGRTNTYDGAHDMQSCTSMYAYSTK